jgi:hypothetical protein
MPAKCGLFGRRLSLLDGRIRTETPRIPKKSLGLSKEIPILRSQKVETGSNLDSVVGVALADNKRASAAFSCSPGKYIWVIKAIELFLHLQMNVGWSDAIGGGWIGLRLHGLELIPALLSDVSSAKLVKLGSRAPPHTIVPHHAPFPLARRYRDWSRLAARQEADPSAEPPIVSTPGWAGGWSRRIRKRLPPAGPCASLDG